MKKFVVHYEDGKQSEPRPHEKKTATLLAALFKSDIVFLRRRQSKTPDLYILRTNTVWELKSPTGGSKHTIQNNLRDTYGQSENVILDLTRSRFTDKRGIARAEEFLTHEKSRIKHLKVLTKTKELVDIK